MDTTLSSIDTANSSGMNTLSSNNSSSGNSSSSSNTNTTTDTTDGLPFCFVRVSLMIFYFLILFFIISFTNN